MKRFKIQSPTSTNPASRPAPHAILGRGLVRVQLLFRAFGLSIAAPEPGRATGDYSYRSAWIGSIRLARTAGTKPAAQATSINPSVASPSAQGSFGVTP